VDSAPGGRWRDQYGARERERVLLETIHKGGSRAAAGGPGRRLAGVNLAPPIYSIAGVMEGIGYPVYTTQRPKDESNRRTLCTCRGAHSTAHGVCKRNGELSIISLKQVNSKRTWELSADRRQCNTTCPAALRAPNENCTYQAPGIHRSESFHSR
jgi:hypothetical protein